MAVLQTPHFREACPYPHLGKDSASGPCWGSVGLVPRRALDVEAFCERLRVVTKILCVEARGCAQLAQNSQAAAPWPGIEPATSWSQVRRPAPVAHHYTTRRRHQPYRVRTAWVVHWRYSSDGRSLRAVVVARSLACDTAESSVYTS